MNPMTEFILFGILFVLPIIIFAIVTSHDLTKDIENDNYEYPQSKNKEELW